MAEINPAAVVAAAAELMELLNTRPCVGVSNLLRDPVSVPERDADETPEDSR